MQIVRLILVALLATAPALGQETADSEADAGTPKPLPAEVEQEFEQRIQAIKDQEVVVAQVRENLAQSEGIVAKLYDSRADAVWAEMFSATVRLVGDLLEQQQDGFDVTALTEQIIERLHVFPREAVDAMERLRDAVIFPTEEMTPAEVAIRDQQLWQATEKYDHVLESMASWLELSQRLGIDDQGVTEFLQKEVQESAANRSSFVHLSLDHVTVMREAAVALPTNEEVGARLSVSEARVKKATASLQSAVTLLNALDLDSSHYREQLVKTTGELSSELLDIGVMSNVVSEWSTSAAEMAASKGPQLLVRLAIMLLILLAFFYLARVTQALTRRALQASKFKLSALATEMVIKSVKNLIFALGILVALSQIGISLGPLLAGLGIAGFIIGFALQDTLSNFASGMLILFYRPFDVGDFVTAGGVTGKVSHMSLVNTTFTTIDNQLLVVPNNKIWSDVITNVTAQQVRRVDLVFGVSYGDDIEKVEKILTEIVDQHELVLDDPEPVIKLHELADSSVNFVCRPWVNTDQYWTVYWDMLRTVKLRFDAEGITIPFPQRELHMAQAAAVAEPPSTEPAESSAPATESHTSDPPPSDLPGDDMEADTT